MVEWKIFKKIDKKEGQERATSDHMILEQLLILKILIAMLCAMNVYDGLQSDKNIKHV
jgi:hypothetical protein